MTLTEPQTEQLEDALPCSRGRVIVLHEATGTIRVVMDRCMRWTCDDCRMKKLAQKTEHLLPYPEPVVFTEDAAPRLDRRAKGVGAGYMKAFLPGQRTPWVLAEAHLYPEHEHIPITPAIINVYRLVKANGCKMVCFNGKWQYQKPAEHLFLGTARGMTHLQTLEAIEDAGFEDMNSGGTDPEVVRRLIGHRLDCIDFP